MADTDLSEIVGRFRASGGASLDAARALADKAAQVLAAGQYGTAEALAGASQAYSMIAIAEALSAAGPADADEAKTTVMPAVDEPTREHPAP